MNSIIHIACAADNKYVQHAGVMLTSLFENNKNNKISVHFFSAEFEPYNVLKLKKIAENYNQIFSFYQLKEEDFKDCFISNHLTFATYYKIIIPLHLINFTSKVLYLDTDIVVHKDLLELWNTKIDDYILAAVNDNNNEASVRLSFPSEYNYFNAGVLLFNNNLWVEKNLSQILFDYIKKYSTKLNFHEQDALNANIYGNWFRLKPEFNQMTILFDNNKEDLLKIYSKLEIETALKDPSIIHYSGTSKPWDYLNTHPLKNRYFEYLKLTEWYFYKPKSNLLDKIKLIMIKVFGKKNYTRLFDLIR